MLLLQKNQKKLSAKKLLPLILPFLFLAGIWLGVFASQKTDREFGIWTDRKSLLDPPWQKIPPLFAAFWKIPEVFWNLSPTKVFPGKIS